MSSRISPLLNEVLVMALFLLVLYPVVQTMTKFKGRAGMFRFRHQLKQGQL